MLILCVDSWYAKWKETNPLSCPQFFKQTMCEDIDLILTKIHKTMSGTFKPISGAKNCFWHSTNQPESCLFIVLTHKHSCFTNV